MEKQKFEIYNTRFIWTIAQMLIFKSTGVLRDDSFFKVCNIAFSHGMRDCQTYREEVTHDINFEEGIKNIDINDIQLFLKGNTKETKVFDLVVKPVNPFDKEFSGNPPQKVIYDIFVNKSIFLPHLAKGTQIMYDSLSKEDKMQDGEVILTFDEFVKQKENNNKNILIIGFMYTKNYLLGFFYGALKYIRRNIITGFYHYSPLGFYCFYKGFENNTFHFQICTDNNEINISNFDLPFDCSHLIV